MRNEGGGRVCPKLLRMKARKVSLRIGSERMELAKKADLASLKRMNPNLMKLTRGIKMMIVEGVMVYETMCKKDARSS